MGTFSRLDALYKTCPRITLEPPVVFIADTHLGDGSKADNFWPHRFRFEKAIERYKPPWKVVTLGDVADRWQFGMWAISQAGWPTTIAKLLDNADIKIPGNHDFESGGPEAVLLTIAGQEIFVTHGHQGDWINDAGRGLGRFLVRYLWTPLERLGLKEPALPGARHAKQRVNLLDWSNTRKVLSIYGHLHTAEETGYCFVCESPITGRMIFLECDGGLRFREVL